MKVSIMTNYYGFNVDSCIANLDLETGIITDLDFTNDDKTLNTIEKDDSYYFQEMQELNRYEISYHATTINCSTSIKVEDEHNEDHIPETLIVSKENLTLFKTANEQNKTLDDILVYTEREKKEMEEKINEILNQFIIYLGNQENHITYGVVGDEFERPFDPKVNYRERFANWYEGTNFHDADTRPDKIRNKETDISFVKEKNTYLFKELLDMLNITYGYGKYFDGESVEPTDKSIKFLEENLEIVSDYLGKTVSYETDVNIDYPEDLYLSLRVSMSILSD